jgi:uncharacterized cupredoxin-like copper-binding protein
MKNVPTLGITLFAMSAIALPALGHESGHQSYSAGAPGDPRKPSRTIEIAMSEMTYEPFKIEVKRGEQIRFVLRNIGTEDHEFMLATTAENLKHAEAMKKHPHMEHDDPNGARVAPKQTAEILWKFTKAGTFEYGCLIGNHREFGMTGHVTVK